MNKFILPIACFLFLTCLSQEKTNNELDSDNQSKLIHKAFELFPVNTEIAFGFIHNGQVTYSGFVKNSNELEPIKNEQSVFEIGSISKVFTSTILANAILEEKVKIKESVNEHLNFKVHNDYEFSMMQLANHTSGLPRMPGNFIFNSSDPSNPFKDYGEKALREFLELYIKLPDKRNVKYEYSNLGAGLLGYALTNIYDKGYEALLLEKVFKKYEMFNSTTKAEKLTSLLVQGLDNKGKPTSNWDLNILVGAGGVLSNVEDMSKFILAQFNNANKELLLTRKETYSINDDMAVGLGWHIKKESNTKRLVWHNGATGGYRSCMVLDIENKNGIVILSNVSGFHESGGKIDKLAFDLLKIGD